MKSAQKVMIYKDVKEVLGSSQLFLPMLIVPLVFVLILPIALLIGAQFGNSGINGMDQLIKIFAATTSFDNDAQLLVYIGVNYLFPSFFLLIPIMAASILGASSFVGEKERKTLESLLYTPMSIRELFSAKVVGTFVPAYAVTLFSFIIFGIVVNIGGWFYFGKLIFPTLKWLIIILWLSPAVTLLGIIFMVLVSAKAATFQEAQQMSAFIVLPIILLVVGQSTGLFLLNEIILLTLGAMILIADYFLMGIATKKFSPEKLI